MVAMSSKYLSASCRTRSSLSAMIPPDVRIPGRIPAAQAHDRITFTYYAAQSHFAIQSDYIQNNTGWQIRQFPPRKKTDKALEKTPRLR